MSVPAILMSGKTVCTAAAVCVLALGAEAVFLPMAMDSSYDRSIESAAALPDIPAQESGSVEKTKEKPRYIPLTPIKSHVPEDMRDLAPVS